MNVLKKKFGMEKERMIMNKILAGLAIGLSSVMAVTHLRFGLSVNASLTGRTKISAFLPFSQFIVQGRSAYILL